MLWEHLSIKVRLDDATLFHETRDSVPTLFQGVSSVARTGSTPPVALKMSSREGWGAMLHEAKLHRVD